MIYDGMLSHSKKEEEKTEGPAVQQRAHRGLQTT